MFEYEYLPTIEDIHQAIIKCEGRHTQQCVFSTFHDALTQICFGCGCIRSNLYLPPNLEEKKLNAS